MTRTIQCHAQMFAEEQTNSETYSFLHCILLYFTLYYDAPRQFSNVNICRLLSALQQRRRRAAGAAGDGGVVMGVAYRHM